MIEQVREIAKLTDDAGFDVLAMTYYFHSEGLEVSVAPIPFFADLAARTQRIKFGSPYSPCRRAFDPSAEEIAVLTMNVGPFIAGILVGDIRIAG